MKSLVLKTHVAPQMFINLVVRLPHRRLKGTMRGSPWEDLLHAKWVEIEEDILKIVKNVPTTRTRYIYRSR